MSKLNSLRDVTITRLVINNEPVTHDLSKSRIREVVRNTLQICTHPTFSNGVGTINHYHDHMKIIRKNKKYWLKQLTKVEEYYQLKELNNACY